VLFSQLPYWIASRTAITLYRLLPPLRPAHGAICVIQAGQEFLFIDRNDGLGFCFPGGAGRADEAVEETMKREVLEETGLSVASCTRLYEFHTNIYYPHSTTVFEAKASGTLKASWEGTPLWLPLSVAALRSFRPHLPVFRRLQLKSEENQAGRGIKTC
jgi:8-oxo-dGTP pyrophosphatase MutT (NUDIX family)